MNTKIIFILIVIFIGLLFVEGSLAANLNVPQENNTYISDLNNKISISYYFKDITLPNIIPNIKYEKTEIYGETCTDYNEIYQLTTDIPFIHITIQYEKYPQ